MKKQKRIEKLTKAQEAKMPKWRDKWIATGLCTEPADRVKFERAAKECYKHAKLEPPKRIVWVDSPIVMAFAGPIASYFLALLRISNSGAVGDAVYSAVDDAVRNAVHDAVGSAVDDAVYSAVGGTVGSAVGDAVYSAVGGTVHDAVGSAVDDAVGGAVHDAVGGAVGDAVYSAVGGTVHDAVGGAVGDAVYSAVGGTVRDAVGVRSAVHDAVGDAVGGAVGDKDIKKLLNDTWYNYIGGQFWSGGWWGSPSFVSFFREVCGLKLDKYIEARAIAYQETCESACWWWPHKEFIIACERPKKISKIFNGPEDKQGRLHCEDGLAVEFRDGWGIAAWRGTVVPIEWIRNRKTLDPSIALTDPSVERRRAAAEIIGWAKILASLPNKTIDTDPDPEIGKLISVDLPDAPGSRFLLVRCATGRDFALPVPRECATALAANAWTYGIEPLDLKQLEERT